MNRALLSRVAPYWVASLVVASLQPWRPRGHSGSFAHYALHFLAWWSTALLLLLCARTARQRLCTPFAVVALGAAIEYAQHLLYRGPFEWYDLATDAFAALLALGCLAILRFNSPDTVPGDSCAVWSLCSSP